MVDYADQAIQLYTEVVGHEVKFRKVSTPYVSDGISNDLDYQTDGQVGHQASTVLMKLLWLTRLARPDLSFAVSSLASQVTRWSRNSDKQLFRLVSYLWSTRNLCLTFSVMDSPSNCFLNMYADADLGSFTATSTSGLFIVIEGPNGTFVPITWSARRQSHVARSTAEAELN